MCFQESCNLCNAHVLSVEIIKGVENGRYYSYSERKKLELRNRLYWWRHWVLEESIWAVGQVRFSAGSLLLGSQAGAASRHRWLQGASRMHHASP